MKILHICAQLDSGGVERVISSYIEYMRGQDMKFVLVKHEAVKGALEVRLKKWGCKIYYVTPKSKDVFRYCRELKKIMKTEKPDVVHCHQGYASFFPLLLAEFGGVPVRIAHAHTAFEPESWGRKRYRLLCTWLTKRAATLLLACQESAGTWMWGNGYQILPNAMQTERFRYKEEIRRQYRKEMGCQDNFVVGCVSRLTPGKNHLFLLEVFREVCRKEENAVLWLVGDGRMRESLEHKAEEEGLLKQVFFLGARTDVANLLNAMDCFVLSSRFEGLGICLIEAQLNGLWTIAGKKGIPPEAAVTERMQFMDTDSAPDWAEHILAQRGKGHEKTGAIPLYDIRIQAKTWKDILTGLLEGEKKTW